MTEAEWIKLVESRVGRIKVCPPGYDEEWKKIPTREEEETFVGLLEKRAPYLAATYGADLLGYIPVIGDWLSKIVRELINWRVKGIKQKEIF